MDKVKLYLGVAKKHHFWILSAVVAITAVVVWIQAKSKLQQRYEADKRTIETAEKAVTDEGTKDKVNETFTKKVDGLHDGLKQQVFEAWKKLYERQVALLKWPVKETENGPIDLNRYSPDEEIPQYVRTFYNQNIVKDQWEELLTKVDLRRKKEAAEPEEGEENADRGEEQEAVAKRGTEYQGLVVWNDDLRKAIVARYCVQNANPSTTRLRLMQEDAWLFESLIQVVNAVNVGATDPLRAPIKQIDVLDVAQWAIAASQQSGAGILVPGGAGGTAAAGGTTGMPANPLAQAAAGGGAGGAAAPAADVDNEWKDGRYLDDKGQPMKAAAPGTAGPFAEFRQVFVYMKFVMDQRRIPDLVAACANAPLPVETRQIRVQTLKGEGDGALKGGDSLFPKATVGATAGGGAMGGAAGGGANMGAAGARMGMGAMMSGPPAGANSGGAAMGAAMMGSRMMGGGGPQMGGPNMMGGGLGGEPATKDDGRLEVTDYDAVVELSGVIYLYNPPDINKLGSGTAGSPEKRSFGVPTQSVNVPGTSSSSSGSIGK